MDSNVLAMYLAQLSVQLKGPKWANGLRETVTGAESECGRSFGPSVDLEKAQAKLQSTIVFHYRIDRPMLMAPLQ